jgi:DNA mismatch repair protein MutH
MSNERLPYDKNNPVSIFEYSRHLLGHTLREMVDPERLHNRKGKGGLGLLVEELYFDYDVNSSPDPDFSEAGIELKCTPLKKLTSGDLQIKERLVCTMIDYQSVVNEDFEHSHFLHKCALMLLLFYLHSANVKLYDLKFLYSVLWKIPAKDLLIIKHDFETIISKVKAGHAEDISEGDTLYLGACRKGYKGQKDVRQPYSNVKAPKRAFSLKPAYMRCILQFIQRAQRDAMCNYDDTLGMSSMVSLEELQSKSFEEILLARFRKFLGLNYIQICKSLHISESVSKGKYSIISSSIATGGIYDNADELEEFQKSGIRLKTIRVEYNGLIKEAMSFENIDYQEVYETDDWFDSRLYEIFSNRFLFVVYKQKHKGDTIEIQSEGGEIDSEKEYVLDKVFFWTMPQHDLEIAKEYWLDIKDKVNENKISLDNFWHISSHRLFFMCVLRALRIHTRKLRLILLEVKMLTNIVIGSIGST